MKPLFLFCFSALLSLPVAADVLLVGILDVGGVKKVVLRDSVGGEDSAWLAEGASFRDFKILQVQPVESQVILEKGGAKIIVTLQNSKVVAAKPDDSNVMPAEPSKPSNAELQAKGLYRVGFGDSGLRIAKNMGVSLADLQRLNPGVNWAKLTVGQVLRFKTVD